MSKETYYNVKRDLLQCQKRPTTVSKEIMVLEALMRTDLGCGVWGLGSRVSDLGFRVQDLGLGFGG